ncbi:MAG: pentapeptide repeat-containing protein [Cyanobium sp.]
MVRFTQAELLRRYRSGERDFRGADLRSLRFRGATLAGTDFSGADLRGTDFRDADLRGSKFIAARCGLPPMRWLGQGLMGIGIGALAGFFGLVCIIFFTTFLFSSSDSLLKHGGWVLSIGIAMLLFASITAFAWEGFTTKGISFLVAAAAAAAAAAVAGTVAAVAVAAFAGAGAGAGALLTIVLFISWWRCRQGAPGYSGCRPFGVVLGSIGATRFSGADLRGAFFTDAGLARASFASSSRQVTRLERICWKGAQGLELARLGDMTLAEPRTLQLLLSGSAPGANLRGLNLRGAYLPQADLRGADLSEANLSEAVLTEARLEDANLKQSQCLGTDLEGAHLTGATLEAWNLDHATNLHGIDCSYVYLLGPLDAQGRRRDDHHRERLPHDPNKRFAPGDFEVYFNQVIEEVKLLIKKGVDPKAFQQAFQEVMRQHPQIRPESLSLKWNGNDVLATLQVPASVDKGAVEQTFFAEYNAVMLENAHLKGQLEGERRAAAVERQRAEDHSNTASQFAELASRLVPVTNHNPNPTSITIAPVFTPVIGGQNAENHSLALSTTTIQAGDGNLINTGSLNTAGGMVNLGDLSDQARLTIEAIPDQRPAEGQPSLRQLLQELRVSVDADTDLPETSRAEALAEIKELATAAQDPKKNVGLASGAINALKGLSAGLSETNKAVAESSKLVGAVKSLLPLIGAFFVG